MFDLYPNVLMVMDTTSGVNDQNVKTSGTENEYVEVCICRAVRNGSGQHIILSNGEDYRYQWVIYMPTGTPAIKDGTPVKILDGVDDCLLTKGRARCFVSSAIGCKMWI